MSPKLRWEDYPDKYPKTDRNCLDCLHLKMKFRVKNGEILLEEKSFAYCKKHFLIRPPIGPFPSHAEEFSRPMTDEEAARIETKYPVDQNIWRLFKRGWTHSEWRAASVCPYFTDMREDHAEDRPKDAISDHLHDSDRYVLPGFMQEMDGAGSAMGEAPSGTEVLSYRAGEGISLPESEST
jgi:hypothetical protein